MNKTPRVIEHVVNNDLCVGCGLCTAICPTESLKMKLNQNGFYIPLPEISCDNSSECITICPTNPFVTSNEDDIGLNLFENDKSIRHNRKIGYFKSTHVGFSKKYRKTSSSGGVTTAIIQTLLDLNIVDKIISVKRNNSQNKPYKYKITDKVDSIKNQSKTRYYPTTLDECFSQIKSTNEKYVVVAIPCFLKGIRLYQQKDSKIRQNITFCIGIVCGGLKSTFFTEYLVDKSEVSVDNYYNPEYREKDYSLRASQYYFQVNDKSTKSSKQLKMWELGDMWGTGMFKANACDFCDDVTSELADISIGDAWISPHINDGRGSNIVITRSELGELIFNEAVSTNLIQKEQLPIEEIIRSQDASFRHRQDYIWLRKLIMYLKGVNIQKKRFGFKALALDTIITQFLRLKFRKKSLKYWYKYRSSEKVDSKLIYLRVALESLRKIKKYRTFYKSKTFLNLFK